MNKIIFIFILSLISSSAYAGQPPAPVQSVAGLVGAPTSSQLITSLNILPHVANNTALAAWNNYSVPVIRDNYANVGDHGGAKFYHSSIACTSPDGGTQVTALDGGCWLNDQTIVTPQIFGFLGQGSVSSVADTQAVQAAANTGRSVNFSGPGINGGLWAPSTCINLTHPGQQIYGTQRYADAVNQVRIQVYASFPDNCPGIFSYTGGEPAPYFHDFGVFFAQPDSANVSDYINYPPMISAVNQPRGLADRIGCYGATVCFDIRGNGGGWTFNDIQANAFKTNADLISGTTYKTGMAASTGLVFRVDGAFDTIRWNVIHIFPFGATTNQTTRLFAQDTSEPIGFQIGRCDGCYIHQMLTITGLSMYIANGVWNTTTSPGASFGEVSESDFDTFNGIVQNAGEWKAVADDFNIGRINSQAIVLTGGNLSVSASKLDVGVATNVPLVQISAGTNDYISGIQFTGCHFDTAGIDIFTIEQSYGNLVLTGNTFNRNTNVSYVNPTIYVPALGRVHASNNIMLQPYGYINGAAATDTFFYLGTDQWNRVIGNDGYGYPSVFPANPTLGIYADN